MNVWTVKARWDAEVRSFDNREDAVEAMEELNRTCPEVRAGSSPYYVVRHSEPDRTTYRLTLGDDFTRFDNASEASEVLSRFAFDFSAEYPRIEYRIAVEPTGRHWVIAFDVLLLNRKYERCGLVQVVRNGTVIL